MIHLINNKQKRYNLRCSAFLFYSLFFIALGISFVACVEPKLSGNVPAVAYASESLNVDLNDLSQPAVICVVNSEIGLKSVSMYTIDSIENEVQLDKTITSFYNPHAYSVSVKPFYTNNMRKFKIVATDFAGQVTVSELPLSITPLTGLPNIAFSDGISNISTINHIEGDPTPNIFVNVSSEEKLKYLLFYQIKGMVTEMINDTIWFYNAEKQATINLKTLGDGYNFPKGLTALKAKIVAGNRNKSKETTLNVVFKAAVQIQLSQTDADFNGLIKNSSVPFSGTIDAATELQSFSYKLIARNGTVISDNQNIPISGNTFSDTFIAYPNLGSVILTAKTVDGKTDERTVKVHVGYKMYHLLASLSGTTTANINTSPGCFFSAEKGMVYDYCGGKANSAFVDIGFGTWNSNKDIRMMRLDTATKFRTLTTCSPNSYTDGAVQDWFVVNKYDVSTSNMAYADFEKSTVTDIENSTEGANLAAGVFIADNFATSPSGQTVGLYKANIGGVQKKVIIAFDKIESINASQPIFSTFWFYAKVQL